MKLEKDLFNNNINNNSKIGYFVFGVFVGIIINNIKIKLK